MTGEGTVLGYELRHPLRPFSTWVVRNGRSGGEFPSSVMLPYSADLLSDADLGAIFDYLASFPQPTTGEGLYLDYCANCHGADARGGMAGADISDKGFNDASEKVRRGEGGVDYGNRAAYMPAFGGEVLSDDELRAITDYLATLRVQ
jgi:mono/diheme cytochrome c family protein